MTSLTDSGLRAAADLWPGLASHVWSSTVFLLAVLAILWALRRRLTAGARCSLVLIGLAKFALPDALAGAGIRALGEAFHIDSPEPLEVPLRAFAGALRVDLAPAEPRLWPAIVLGLWGLVALGLILRLAWAHHRLARLAPPALLPPRPRDIAALERAQQRTGVRGSLDISRSAFPEAPAVLGVLRPRIVLPVTGCDDLSEDELESLLGHECAHVARHDNLVASCVSLLCALFWFHPLIWIARRILWTERERACDEMAAGSGDGGEIYLTALTKFCHAAIGPEVPGISRMATAHLKERMDHVMNYADLKRNAPSPRRVALLGAAALTLFTLASGVVGSERVFAEGKAHAYSIRLTGTRAGGTIALAGSVRDNETQEVIASPALTLDASRTGSVRSSAPGGVQVALEARPEEGDRLVVDVTVEKAGEVVQKSTLRMTPSAAAAAEPPQAYTGEPIDLSVTNADLREVLTTFGQITGMPVRIDAAVQGRVSVSWHNVPWDEALDSIVRENGLAYRIEGKTLVVSKR